MKVVSLEISENSRNLLKSDSIFNNHSDIDLYYFSIPTKLSISDQNHLIKQCFLFFQSQFAINIDNKISIRDKREIRINFKKSKDLSWEIFFRFNRWIRVCDGIFDEDLDWFISGFTGKIIDFYSDDETSVFLIAFSGKSIAKIPLDHLQKSINNISPFYTFLNPELIMPDTPPEDENIDEVTRIGIMLKFINFQNYSDLLTIESFSEYLNYWEEQFRSNLVDPVEARINLSDQVIYQLLDIPYFDERFGVWGTFASGEKIIDIPLMEIGEITNNNFFKDLIVKYQKTMSYLLPN